MAGRVPHAELNAVRALVSGSLTEIDAAVGPGQVWARAACTRLSAVDGLLAECAGVLTAPVQVAVATIVTFLVVLLSATLAAVAGLSTAGLLLISGGAVMVTLVSAPPVNRRVTTALGRRRLARLPVPRHRTTRPPPARSTFDGDLLAQASSKGRLGGTDAALTPTRARPFPTVIPSPASDGFPAGVPSPVSDGVVAGAPSPVSEDVLDGVHERLLLARVRLVSLAMRLAGSADWTAPLIRRAIRTDPVIRRLAHTDQLLCQAIDCLERHLGLGEGLR